jgi:hypothetical protein
MKQIAFCFLLYDKLNHGKTWKKFFEQDDTDSHTIYAHLKKTTKKTQQWIKKHKIKPVKTAYCDVSLVYAWIELLKNALKDKDNKYFVIISGECIPLFQYADVYKKINASKKSRINVVRGTESEIETGLYYADQWCTLNRKQAELLLKLKTTEKGKQFDQEVLDQIGDFCPDEIIPINWFVEHYGKPSSTKFKKEFRNIPTTFTYWDEIHYSPVKFNASSMKKMRKKICKSKAIFGRKFNARAARLLSQSC